MRETFRDKDTVRVHPIMTKGGDLVNVIPNEAVIETLVRANNTEEILDASEKTDRAFLAGAVAVGAGRDRDNAGISSDNSGGCAGRACRGGT